MFADELEGVSRKALSAAKGSPTRDNWSFVRHHGPPGREPLVLGKKKTHIRQRVVAIGNSFPKTLAKSNDYPDNFSHFQFVERLDLLCRKRRSKSNRPRLMSRRFQYSERQSYQDLRTLEDECPIGIVACHLHVSRLPMDALNNRLLSDRDITCGNVPVECLKQVFVAVLRSKCSIAINFFFSAQLLHKPMNSDNRWIRGIEATNVREGALLRLLQLRITVLIGEFALQKM